MTVLIPFEKVVFEPQEQLMICGDALYANLEAIRNLKSRYLSAVDNKDWPAMLSIFTDDAIIDFSGEDHFHVGHHGLEQKDLNPTKTVVIGGEAAAERIERAVGGIITVHQAHDPQIAFSSKNQARGKWSLYDQLDYGDEVMHGYGHYHETYVLTASGWRISSLLLTRIKVNWEQGSV